MGPRVRRFIHHYLESADLASAALAAGYSQRDPRQRGLLLLRMPEVRATIMRERARRAKTGGLTLPRVLLEYERIALADLGRLLGADARPKPLLELAAEDAAAIRSVAFDGAGAATRIGLHDKGFALEALSVYFRIYEPEEWRDETEGARDRLLEKLRAMAAAQAEEEAHAAEEHDAAPDIVEGPFA